MRFVGTGGHSRGGELGHGAPHCRAAQAGRSAQQRPAQRRGRRAGPQAHGYNHYLAVLSRAGNLARAVRIHTV